MTNSQPIHGFGQSILDHKYTTFYLEGCWSCSLGWDSHGECTNVYSYTLDKTYSKSLLLAIK